MQRVVRKSRSNSRRGFTLTELLIVMAILVLLVSLVGPRLLGSKQKADVNSVKTQIGMFQAALERFAIDMNRFPTTEEGLGALVEAPSGDSGGSDSFEDGEAEVAGAATNWDGAYLKTTKVPTDPWGKPYRYEFPPTHGKGDLPDIWSLGPDGQENTEDDIVSWDGEATSDDAGDTDVASNET